MKERIDQLERKCKRLTLAVTGMMILAVAAVCIAAKPNSQKDGIQTNKLEIVDDEGNVRISLGREDSGYGVVVYDEDGKFGATLTDAPLGAGMQLRKDGGSIKMPLEAGLWNYHSRREWQASCNDGTTRFRFSTHFKRWCR